MARRRGQGPGITEATIIGNVVAVEVEGIDLSETKNPLDVAVHIGNDLGQTVVRLYGSLCFVTSDADRDCDVDLLDYDQFVGCLSGPNMPASPGCEEFDVDGDGDVDLSDFGMFQRTFGEE